MQRRNRITPLLAIVALGLVLAACHGGRKSASGDDAGKARRLGGGEVYVVGRVELVPALKEGEQELRTVGSGRLRNRAYVFFSDRFVDFDDLGMGSGKHAQLVDIGKHFVIKRKNPGTLHYTGGMVWMRSSASHSGYMNSQTTIQTGHMFLKSRTTYRLRPDDRAVYVGTYRYYRDAYNAITRVERRDDYAEALQEFRKKVSDPGITLRKAVPEPAK